MTRCIVYRYINGPVDRVARVPGASPVIHTSKFDIKIEVNSENVCKVDKRGISDRMIKCNCQGATPGAADGDTRVFLHSLSVILSRAGISVTEPPLGPIVLFSITGEVGLVSLCICQ